MGFQYLPIKTALLMASLTLVSATAFAQKANYQRTSDGVVLTFKRAQNNTHLLRLQVMNEHIIRVTASPSDSFSTTPSLMIANENYPAVPFNVEEKEDNLILSTLDLKVVVSLTTGQIQYANPNGNILLKEKAGGRTFSPETIEDVHAYRIRQIFDNINNSALYGLGENQLGLTNIKGKDITLAQHNSEAFVPFVVSSGNYGILWDNNSITRFGNPAPWMPLDSFKLFNKFGEPGSLTAIYSPNLRNDNDPITRADKTIDYPFLKDLKNLPKDFSLTKPSSVEWDGYIESSYTGKHSFLLYFGGYISIQINDTPLFPRPPFIPPIGGKEGGWRQSWNPAEALLHFTMQKGKKYAIKIKWIPDGEQSFLSLKWKKPESAAEQKTISLSSEMGKDIDYYFIQGQNIDSVISGYRTLTGKSPIMPIWAYGFWQSREHYDSSKEILDIVREFRQRHIPIDNIVQDWFYWKKDKWGTQQFDPARYPDPKRMIDSLHQNYHVHFMISVWPKFYTGTKVFNEFWNKGWLYKKNVEDSTKDWVGYVSTFYDAFNKDARKAFWNLANKNLFNLGVDAWWLDASEPDIYSNTSIATRKQLMNPTALGPSTEYFNAYPLENDKTFYNGQREAKPNQRVFILTRSAFAGSQRYAAATWSGDIGATWRDMKNQIATGISFSMSGIPYWTMDIGGFATEERYQHPDAASLAEWREQMTRWYQFGAFCPLFRAHGQAPYREPFVVAPEGTPAYESILYYDKLRYRLLPYIYSLAGAVYLDNYTIMRGLAMDFENDSIARNSTDEYMFGPDLLISPVYTYKARTRKVYLPTLKLRQTGLSTEASKTGSLPTEALAKVGWYDLYTGKYFRGGQTITANAPYIRMPVFVKAGAIIPFGPALQYTQQKKADTITLYVYTGQDGHFNLYEDDGVSYDYEKGMYSIIPLKYSEQSHTLTIGKREGEFPDMLQKRVFRIKWISREKPEALNFSSKPDKTIHYDGKRINVRM